MIHKAFTSMSIDQQNRVGNDVLELLVVRELGGDYGMMVRRLRELPMPKGIGFWSPHQHLLYP